jgi:hypothetical protein
MPTPLLESLVARATETELAKLYRIAVGRLLFYTYRRDAVRLFKKVHKALDALEKKRPFRQTDLFRYVWDAYIELIKPRLPQLLPEELKRLESIMQDGRCSGAKVRLVTPNPLPPLPTRRQLTKKVCELQEERTGKKIRRPSEEWHTLDRNVRFIADNLKLPVSDAKPWGGFAKNPKEPIGL